MDLKMGVKTRSYWMALWMYWHLRGETLEMWRTIFKYTNKMQRYTNFFITVNAVRTVLSS